MRSTPLTKLKTSAEKTSIKRLEFLKYKLCLQYEIIQMAKQLEIEKAEAELLGVPPNWIVLDIKKPL